MGKARVPGKPRRKNGAPFCGVCELYHFFDHGSPPARGGWYEEWRLVGNPTTTEPVKLIPREPVKTVVVTRRQGVELRRVER